MSFVCNANTKKSMRRKLSEVGERYLENIHLSEDSVVLIQIKKYVA